MGYLEICCDKLEKIKNIRIHTIQKRAFEIIYTNLFIRDLDFSYFEEIVKEFKMLKFNRNFVRSCEIFIDIYYKKQYLTC